MTLTGQTLRKAAFAFLQIGFCLTTAHAQDTAETPRIIRKPGGVLHGSANRRVEPSYPPLAKATKVSGAVVVEVTVDEEGNVFSARALSGHPLLKDSAVTAARGWRFAPTKLEGVPVKVIGTITFNFHLDETTSESNELEELRQKVAANPGSPELLYELGEAYLAGSQPEKAIEAFSHAIELKPDFAAAYCELGRAHHSLDQVDEALAAVQRAVQIDPKMESAAYAYLLIGTISHNQGRFQEAIEAYKQTLFISSDSGDSNSGAAHFGLAAAYVEVGDKQSALKEYEALRKIEWISPGAIKSVKQRIDLMH